MSKSSWHGNGGRPSVSGLQQRIYGPVVQMVRTLACHARGRGFESLPGRQCYASVAQSVEQGTENPRVGGSIAPRSTNIWAIN